MYLASGETAMRVMPFSKLAMISARFSSVLREVRGFTPPREANVHRYILLFFMIATIVLGNWLLILYLEPFMRFA